MTLRDKIKSIQKVYEPQDEDAYLDKVMELVRQDAKERYGWTDEDIPFKYNQEVEIQNGPQNKWHRAIFKAYVPSNDLPYEIEEPWDRRSTGCVDYIRIPKRGENKIKKGDEK